jgi:hypothetical protein
MGNHDEAIQFAKSFLKSEVLFNDAKGSDPSEADMVRMGEALEAAARDPDTNDFDTLVMLAAGLMRENERLPDWLASFAADVLAGKQKRPTKRGADKYKNWQRDYSLWRAVDNVANNFDLPKYTNNELSNKTTSATIVAKAAGLNVDVVITAYKRFNQGGK